MATVSRTPGVVTAVVDDQLVLLEPHSEAFFSLNETGAQIWNLLAEPTTEDALVTALLEEYEVSEAQCRDTVATFLSRARAQGVLQTG